jgi:hypothetical protein
MIQGGTRIILDELIIIKNGNRFTQDGTRIKQDKTRLTLSDFWMASNRICLFGNNITQPINWNNTGKVD